ncbi:hypothetical protein, partial [Hoeflea sp.]|uniref:hypothetical protein n=1 Tax=Hoeflea sp. TaxID=1940281 RepID=UPI002AFF8F9D
SLNGLMMAITIFIWFPILVVTACTASENRVDGKRQRTPLEGRHSSAVPVWKKSSTVLNLRTNM